MTMATAVAGPIIFLLAGIAGRALAVAGGAGLGLALFRVKAASPRLLIWTAVLYAALAMPLLAWMLPPLSVPGPAFLQDVASRLLPGEVGSGQREGSSPRSIVKQASVGREETAPGRAQISPRRPIPGSHRTNLPPQVTLLPASLRPSIPWSAVAAAIYLAGALLLFVRLGIGMAFAHRLIRASHGIDDSRIILRIASRARASGLSSVPRVAESELIVVPVTVGVTHSLILLPADWPEWDDAKLDAVIAHEMSHVARHDALTQRLALLHRAIFWFSPLAWWLEGRLAVLAEQASDEAALSCGADRRDYARTLLGFFEALHAAPGRVWWQGVAMAKAGQAEQRLERILAWRGAVPMGWKKSGLKKSITIAIVAVSIPVVYLAASVRPTARGTLEAPQAQVQAPSAAAQPGVPQAPSVATIPPAPAPRARNGISHFGPAPIGPAFAPRAQVAPFIPLPPPRAGFAWPSSFQNHGYSYAYGGDDGESYAIVSGNSRSVTMSGSGDMAEHIEQLKKRISADFIWFERDDRSYVIRDQATIERAKKLFAPQEELGKQQEDLGKQQEELGKQQEELGEKMDQVRVSVPDLTADLDKLRDKLKQLKAGATQDEVGEIQSQIGELQEKLGEVQSQAGDQQSKLGELMEALGRKQERLGEQQERLGHEQEQLSRKANREMKALFDEAIKKGTAQPEPETGADASL